jgi:hypothetical protein
MPAQEHKHHTNNNNNNNNNATAAHYTAMFGKKCKPNILAYWYMTPSSLVDSCLRLGETRCLHFRSRRLKQQLMTIPQGTRRHIPADSNLKIYIRQNLTPSIPRVSVRAHAYILKV